MKNWEEEHRLKQYHSKIKHAKATFRVEPADSRHSGQSDDLGLSHNCLFSMLRLYNLQQYTREMESRGWARDWQKLRKLSPVGVQSFMDDLKIYPGHQTRMTKLISDLKSRRLTLREGEFMLAQTGFQQDEPLTKLPAICSSSNQRREGGSSALTNKLSQKHRAREDQDSLLIELTSMRQEIKSISNLASKQLKPYPTSSKNRLQTKIQPALDSLAIKSKAEVPKPLPHPLAPDTATRRFGTLKLSETNNSHQFQARSKSIKSKEQRVPRRSKNRVVEQIRAQKDTFTRKDAFHSFRSIEGLRLTSTMINIDIEEISFCTAATFICWIDPKDKYVPTKPIPKDSDNQPSDEQMPASESASQKPELSLDGKGLSSDAPPNSAAREQRAQTQTRLQQQAEACDQLEEGSYYSESMAQSKAEIDLGFVGRYDSFYQREVQNHDYFVPPVDQLASFIKNVMQAAKMEREIPIMAMIYVRRFVEGSPGFTITTINYKRLLMIAFLVASKYWDDQSFETHSFSQVFPSLPTVLLNEMEKVFLQALGYRLDISKEKYAMMYMLLRQNRASNIRSYNLKSLPLSKVLELQRGVRRAGKGGPRDKST